MLLGRDEKGWQLDRNALRFEPGRLDVRVGIATDKGRRPDNQDFALAYLGTPESRRSEGVIAAIADGVAGSKGGRVAAELAVRGFVDGFLQQRPTLAVPQAAAIALQAIGDWIEAQGRNDPELAHMATTFTALVLRGRRAYGIHIGDSRLFRFSRGQLTPLTTDHHVNARVLSRAIGLPGGSRADYCVEAAMPGDRFLLTSDGVHTPLSAARLGEILGRQEAPDETAEALVRAALAAGGRDNASALVVDIVEVPAPSRADLAAELAVLPVGPLPEAGETVDRYRLDAILSDGPMSRLFRATDLVSGQTVVAKFPDPELSRIARVRAAFLREAWITSRLSGSLAGGAPPADPQQTRLYLVAAFYPGETLEQRLSRPPPVALDEGIAIALKLAKAVTALHRAGIIHRDIKPGNVMLLPGGAVRLIDFGLARAPGLEEAAEEEEEAVRSPGTPGYLAPELQSGESQGDLATDVYALGVTLYRMFSGGAFPYGKTLGVARQAGPTALMKHRRDLPAWLDAVLLRAVATAPEERYADPIDLGFALENGESFRPRVKTKALYDRNPLLFWKIVSSVLFLVIVLLLALRI